MRSTSHSSQSSRASIKSNQLKERASKDTQRLIESMMKDSKLTKYQKDTIQEVVKNKKSLPSHGIAVSRDSELNDYIHAHSTHSTTYTNMFGQKSFSIPRKKALDTMIVQGAFEQEKCPTTKFQLSPEGTILNVREREKDYLNTYFEFGGKNKTPQEIIDARFPTNRKRPENAPKTTLKPMTDRFNELVNEVNERYTWLTEMREIGQSEPFESLMRSQISGMIREMEQIDKERSKVLSKNIPL